MCSDWRWYPGGVWDLWRHHGAQHRYAKWNVQGDCGVVCGGIHPTLSMQRVSLSRRQGGSRQTVL